MIDSKELRIGNWVYSDEIGKPVKIELVSIDNWVSFGSITFDQPTIDEIKPIPLTKEWLIDKFEATLIGREYKLKAYELEITIRINGGTVYCKFGNVYLCGRIQYVHELQNLYFALCGKELEVKP